ncbi:glycosyl hydrolase [Galbibacter mesophilus]|uniref:glycosyl hydrolase n=1 Tax=Galbibacter mesophilus TaxID=379069 RepID=UPI00191E0AF6|nr:glycosyl hydrolase [Galbibacter mesophilus]MCM5664036.1 glycosyl hydrolase [Galbibacter mesophilus]
MKVNYPILFIIIFFTFQLSARDNLQPYPGKCKTSLKYLYWTGEVDNDFFNEKNWRIAIQNPIRINLDGSIDWGSIREWYNKPKHVIWLVRHDRWFNAHPRSGTIDPGQPIKHNLYAENANLEVNGDVVFDCNENGLTLKSSTLVHNNQWNSGVVSLDKESTVHFNLEQQSHEGVKYNLLDARSWIYFHQNNPNELLTNAIESLYQNHEITELNSVRIDQYYQAGSVYRRESVTYAPLTVYNGNNNTGNSAEIPYYNIYEGASIPEGMDNSITSFTLKRGFQATFAIEENGTSMSKVYIASEEDLVIDNLPLALQNNISFIRVMPWEWVVKRGTGGYYDGLNAGWYYNWGNSADSEPNYHYAPMTWGAGPTRPDGINRIIAKQDVNQLLGFNESDNCEDQSGQFNNLCEPEVAVAYYENIMGTGLRLGTPAPRENGPFGWLDEFAQIAKDRNVRFDFVAVHWYDWGSNPRNSPNAPAGEIFDRFKNYLNRVHEKYKLPIWITEFNANPNRGNATQEEFLRLALPYLESLEYVERYAYFQPNPKNSSTPNEPAYFYDDAGNLTNIGNLYLNQKSTASIPELSYEAPNNLEGIDQPFEEEDPIVIAFEAECSPYLGNQASLLADETASNNYYLKLDEDKEGAKDLAKQVHFEFELDTADTYRIWVRYKSSTGTNSSIHAYVDGSEEYDALGGLNSNNFRWEQLPRFYNFEEGNHRLTIELEDNRFLFDAVALISGSGDIDLLPKDGESCIPPDDRWGANDTDITYFQEAEASNPLRESWQIRSNDKAIGGAFIQSELSSVSTPPAASAHAVFNFEIAESDAYEVWGKVQALETSSDAFWVKVDDGSFLRWDNLKNEDFLWYWKKVHNSYPNEDRSNPFFLDSGVHSVTIAYNEANTKIDRIAISSVDKSPALEDPNVLLGDTQLSFEAENALLIGDHTIGDCDQASNAQQVRPANAETNRIRFENVSFSKPGIRTLQITYMSANSRVFGLVVNNVKLPDQTVESSGAWCFGSGETAVYEVEVELQAGANSIEITGAGSSAPFIDKISFKSGPLYNMEAEMAVLNGNATVQSCENASNGAYVNTLEFSGNSIEFQNISVSSSGRYEINIDYISKNERQMHLFVDGKLQGLIDFRSSGEWCFQGGTPTTFSKIINLDAGTHTILLGNAGVAAPLVDKISIVEISSEGESMDQTLSRTSPSELQQDIEAIEIAPNPVYPGESVSVFMPDGFDRKVRVEVYDMSGRLVYAKNFQREGDTVKLNPNLNTGQYMFLIIENNGRKVSKYLIVK